MNKHHEKILYLYSMALDAGDFEAISQIWDNALDDEELTAKLIEFGLQTNAEDMRTLPLSNGKIQPHVRPSQMTNLATDASLFNRRRQQTWQVAVLLMIILSGVFAYATFYADQPVYTTLIQHTETPTPSPTPFQNPIQPSLHYTTHKPILSNGQGVLSFSYPEMFKVVEDNENGVVISSKVFDMEARIIAPGDIRGARNTDIPYPQPEQSFDEYINYLMENFYTFVEADPADIVSQEKMIEDRRVIQFEYANSTEKTMLWVIDTPTGPILVLDFTANIYSQLEDEIIVSILPTLAFEADIEPIALDYQQFAETAVQVDLIEHVPQTVRFNAEQRGLVYQFSGQADNVFTAMATTNLQQMNWVEDWEIIQFFLLNEDGTLLGETTQYWPHNFTQSRTEVFIQLPEDGIYTLLMMPMGNDNQTQDPVGGEYTVYWQRIETLTVDDDAQTGTLEAGYPHYFIVDAEIFDYLEFQLQIPPGRQMVFKKRFLNTPEAPLYQLDLYTGSSQIIERDGVAQTHIEKLNETNAYLIQIDNRAENHWQDSIWEPNLDIAPIDYEIKLHEGDFPNAE